MRKLTAVQRAVRSGHQGGEAARLEAVQGGILRLQGVWNALSLHSRLSKVWQSSRAWTPACWRPPLKRTGVASASAAGNKENSGELI